MVQLNFRVLARAFRDRRSSLYEQPVCRVDVSCLDHLDFKWRVEPSAYRHLRDAVIDIRILPVPNSVIRVEGCDYWQGKSGSDQVACSPPHSA